VGGNGRKDWVAQTAPAGHIGNSSGKGCAQQATGKRKTKQNQAQKIAKRQRTNRDVEKHLGPENNQWHNLPKDGGGWFFV